MALCTKSASGRVLCCSVSLTDGVVAATPDAATPDITAPSAGADDDGDVAPNTPGWPRPTIFTGTGSIQLLRCVGVENWGHFTLALAATTRPRASHTQNNRPRNVFHCRIIDQRWPVATTAGLSRAIVVG